MKVFNRAAKVLQKQRFVVNSEAPKTEYLRDHAAKETLHRLSFIKRPMTKFLEFGSHTGNFAKLVAKGDSPEAREISKKIKDYCMVDGSENAVSRDEIKNLAIRRIVADEEEYAHPVLNEPNQFDVVLSNLSLHWINNLPKVLENINSSLKPDGVFMGSMFSTDTLFELRTCLQLAEMERFGGVSPRVSPFVEASELGSLLGKAKFKLTTVDVDEIIVDYPDIVTLMRDLQLMGESGANLSPPHLMRQDLLLAAGSIYQAIYGSENESIPATFRIAYMIGWKEGPHQPEPSPRGSAQVNLKDVLK